MTSEFGTFRLTYEPPSGFASPTVEMTQTGDSTIPDMLYMFEAFLQASGFVLKGDLQIVEDTPVAFDFEDTGLFTSMDNIAVPSAADFNYFTILEEQ